jgi:hypothetical protein
MKTNMKDHDIFESIGFVEMEPISYAIDSYSLIIFDVTIATCLGNE